VALVFDHARRRPHRLPGAGHHGQCPRQGEPVVLPLTWPRELHGLGRSRCSVHQLSPCQTVRSGPATRDVTIPASNSPSFAAKSRACILQAL
jgi:hypothetical protein